MSQNLPASDVNDNDKLMAALAYFFPVIVPVIILLVESMNLRPYQKYHAIQSLGLSVVALIYSVIACITTAVCGFILTLTVVGAIVVPCLFVFFLFPFIPNIYYAIIAYARPAYFEIPVVTKFMKQQGWLSTTA